MTPIIEKLKAHLEEQQPDFGDRNAQSLLDMLYVIYTEHNPTDNEVTKAGFAALNENLKKLTLEENSRVFDVVCDLCGTFERNAFMEGLCVGMRLLLELQAQPE